MVGSSIDSKVRFRNDAFWIGLVAGVSGFSGSVAGFMNGCGICFLRYSDGCGFNNWSGFNDW